MREIKFQVKIKHKTTGNFWVDIITLDELLDRNGCLYNKGIQEVVYKRQYTGLKDKNGKEIYEGDLLRVHPKSEWEKTNFAFYEVFFHDEDANMDYNIGFSIARCHYQGAVCGGYIPSFKPKQVLKMEVIGNIYENPELLNN